MIAQTLPFTEIASCQNGFQWSHSFGYHFSVILVKAHWMYLHRLTNSCVLPLKL